MQKLTKMMDNLAKPLVEKVQMKSEFYICNIITGECICWEYVWNSSIRDKCKHCYAAEIYKDAKEKGVEETIGEIMKQLVAYFRNKERILPVNSKNYIIYQDTIENSFQEIVRLYKIYGRISIYINLFYIVFDNAKIFYKSNRKQNFFSNK